MGKLTYVSKLIHPGGQLFSIGLEFQCFSVITCQAERLQPFDWDRFEGNGRLGFLCRILGRGILAVPCPLSVLKVKLFEIFVQKSNFLKN
jgi:hypothetical protein